MPATLTTSPATKPPPLAVMLKQAAATESSAHIAGEIVEIVETDSANPTFSPPPHTRDYPVPDDSILGEYRDYVRGVSEAPDGWLVAPMLAVCARLLTPRVWWDFAGPKAMTLFQFIVGPAGIRKSTSFNPAEAVARAVLREEDFVTGNASDSALFKSFEANPDRLQLEDEGNTILQTWATAHYGREVASRYLKLYDGRPWGQNFHREGREHDDGVAERRIDRATLSLCVGATFGVSQFNGIDAASGLRRRFGYYLATEAARVIVWPRSFDKDVVEHFAAKFKLLSKLEGRMTQENLTAGAQELWKRIQHDNRDMVDALNLTAADEAHGAALNESPARILKLATIFQACRWAAGNCADSSIIDASVLEMAHAHQAACLESSAELDTIGRRSSIQEVAETILARIRVDFARPPHLQGREIVLTKTELTAKFASHPERRMSLTPHTLHYEIMPALMKCRAARIKEQEGKRVLYAIKLDD